MGLIDIVGSHKAFLLPFLFLSIIATIYAALQGGGWGSLIVGTFMGVLAGLLVHLGAKKIRGEML